MNTHSRSKILSTFLFFTFFTFSANPNIPSEKAKRQNDTGQPRNIILMIGDGMGLTQITSAMYSKKDKLNLERFFTIGLIKTHSSDNLITDSAAGATAFSTGQKSFNGAIGVDENKKSVSTILEIAEKNNRATGLVAVCSITHATPASFIAHQDSRSKDENIALDFLATDIDVFIGGGRKFFENRSDGKNLVQLLESKNYTVLNGIENVADRKIEKLACFTALEHPMKMSEGRGDLLGRSAMTAISILNKKNTGFFLMIEGSQIDWGGHAKDAGYVIAEALDFDETIGKVLDWAEKDGKTLVIVTADHETGGMAITGGKFPDQKIENSFIYGNHTAALVPVFAYGPGAENFSGIYQNTDIFYKMLSSFGFSK